VDPSLKGTCFTSYDEERAGDDVRRTRESLDNGRGAPDGQGGASGKGGP